MTLVIPSRIQDSLNEISYSINSLDSPVPEIERLINQSLLVGGKRLRPLLSLLVADWIGLDKKNAISLARSVELVHAASLAHDDVLDESDFRRRKPTLRLVSSNSRAILSGDLLLSQTLREISELGSLNIVQSLARSAEMLVYGEWLQQELIGNVDVEEEQLLAVHHNKTASLMEWACCAPLLLHPTLSNAAQFKILESSFKELGRLIGAAFQIMDDVVDFSTQSEKPFALDLTEGLVNTVSLRLLLNNPSLKPAIRKILETHELPVPLPWRPEELEKAILEMRSQAASRIYTAQKVVEDITQILPMKEDTQSAFDSLFWMMGERKK